MAPSTSPAQRESLGDLLDRQAARGGTALVYRDREIGFGALRDGARRLASGLRALGVAPGDRVALWLPNIPAYLEAVFACGYLGAIAVAVNTRFRSAEVADIVARSGTRILILWPGFNGIDFCGILERIDPGALSGLGAVVCYGEDDAAARPPADRLPASCRIVDYASLLAATPIEGSAGTADSACAIFTTSGTTSRPKFVTHDQATMVRHGRDVAQRFGYAAPGALTLQIVPLCGVFGMCQAMGALAGGAPSILMPVFDAAAAARIIRTQRVTQTNGSDDMVARLLDAAPGPDPFPSLNFVGFARFNPALGDLVERADARGVRMCGVYGMSECMALFSVWNPDQPVAIRARGGGIPSSPDAEVRIADPQTGAPLPDGAAGEILLRAPSLMIGYFGDPEATRAAFTAGGYFRTGDLGLREDGGTLVYLSRMGDALRLGGFLVNPQEIEAVLRLHPAVDGCQVVGATAGTRPVAVAFVTVAAGRSPGEAALIAFCTGRLADYKIPRRVLILDAFPVTEGANGIKVQRHKLRMLAQAALDADTVGAGAVGAAAPGADAARAARR